MDVQTFGAVLVAALLQLWLPASQGKSVPPSGHLKQPPQLPPPAPHHQQLPVAAVSNNKKNPVQAPLLQPRDWLQKIGSSNFTYSSLVGMLNKKRSLLETIGNHIRSIQEQEAISPEVHLKMNVLAIYQRELRAVENSLVLVLKDLNQTLSSDYRSIANIKRSCKERQEDMMNAAVFVEEDFNRILDLEKALASLHPNISIQFHFKLVDEFLSEISHAADTLESDLSEDIFSNYKKMKGAGLETVVKLSEDTLLEHSLKRLREPPGEAEEERTRHKEMGRRRRKRSGISMIIDSSSNQYILSRPRDVTVPIEDHHFIHDIIHIVLLSFALGSACSLFKVPSLFGYIFAGMVLGPTGWNVVESVVQVETLGEVGVIFIIFMVGLEFSVQKLQKVWRVAVYGGNLLLASSILLAILLGLGFRIHPRHSLFVAACLSFSSSPLATRISDKSSVLKRSLSNLEEHKAAEADPEPDIADSVSGVLVMQDIQLGTLMALLPFFEGGAAPLEPGGGAEGGVSEDHWLTVNVYWFLQLLQVLFGLPVVILVLRSAVTRVVGRFHRQLSAILSQPENLLLSSVSLCFGTVLVAEMLSGSLELGCFLAGVVISSRGAPEAEQVKRLAGPIRDFFAVFFFASLGFHVYPTFLRSEFTTMTTVMVCIISLKFFLSVGVLGLFTGHCRRTTFIMSVSLAQVSEFSFVLSSRARRLDIISREVYLVVLSVTTLSLLLSPILWRLLLLSHPSTSLLRRSLLAMTTTCSSPSHPARTCLRWWGGSHAHSTS